MKVTAKITKSFTDAGKLKAFATVCLADALRNAGGNTGHREGRRIGSEL